MTQEHVLTLIDTMKKALERLDEEYPEIRDTVAIMSREAATIRASLDELGEALADVDTSELEDVLKAVDFLETGVEMLSRHQGFDEIDAFEAELEHVTEDDEEAST